MLFIQHNLLSQNANRQLKVSTDKNAKTTEKLSSGYQINRAADDAAGLSISEKMRRQVRGLHQTVDNISEGVGYVQTAEGALNEVQDMLQRINELAVKAANGTNTNEDRMTIDREIQQLKNEMNRIFSETTFNERKIWEPDEIESPNGGITPLVTAVYTSKNINITEDTCDVLPINTQGSNTAEYMYDRSFCTGNFTVNANEDGITVSWTGYNGKKYKTENINWGQLKENNYRFDIGSKFDRSVPELFNSEGLPVFSYEIAFNPADEATEKEICDAINGRTIPVTTYNPIQGSWEDTTSDSSGFRLSGYLNYWAAYDSHNSGVENSHDFGEDDLFLEPVVTNGTNLTTCPTYTTVDAAKSDPTRWTFALKLEGIGDVIASSTKVRYRSNQYAPEDEGRWWETYSVNGVTHTRYLYKETSGTLAGVMNALDKTNDNGLFSDKHHGESGAIYIWFQLNSADGKDVGACAISFDVNKSDTMEEVHGRISKALNDTTILDFTTNENREYSSIESLYPKTEYIDTTRGFCNFFVQAGTEGGQHINIKYDALNTYVLNMRKTNVLTRESAESAINEVKAAIQIVSKQRSDFGAFQNRLEHAQNINSNVEENTQSAESLIRDTDIADTMMEFSINNILMQAGTSMLTQANQSSQSILELLQ